MKMKFFKIKKIFFLLSVTFLMLQSCSPSSSDSNSTPDPQSSKLPAVSTKTAVDIICTNFKESGGSITSDGGYSITSKGICWGVNPNPTINNYFTNDGTGASEFSSMLTNLLPITTYYYRAYATNSIGTGYGITYTFTTASTVNPSLTDIDGNIYQTTKICNQTWTTTNLNVSKYRNGDEIPQITVGVEWKKADYNEIEYITSLKELGIFNNIKNNYSVTLPTEIVLQVDDDFGFSRNGLSVIIEDPIEVEKFLNHEDAVGFNNDGEGIDIKRGNSSIIDWSSVRSILFVIREI